MRVKDRSSSTESGAERGAIIVIVALGIVVLLGAAALAIDIGNGWQTRRHAVNASDGGALAAAQEYALGGTGCDAVAAAYVSANFPTATMADCAVRAGSNSTSGAVLVAAEATVDVQFGEAIGFGDYSVDSSTVVEWGIPSAVSGLRPFGLCSQGSTAFQSWLSNPSTSQTITIPYGKDDNPNACNGGANVPGNWGVLDFNGGSNPQTETNEWTEDGYDDLVAAGTLGGTCTAEPYACYPGNTGAFNNPLDGPLTYLQTNNIEFTLPIFDAVYGNGANTEFHLVYFVNVELVAFQVNGPQADRYLTLEFKPGLAQGECCNNSGTDTGLRVIQPCAVDATDPNAC